MSRLPVAKDKMTANYDEPVALPNDTLRERHSTIHWKRWIDYNDGNVDSVSAFDGDREIYDFSVARLRTPNDLEFWLRHLREKDWFDDRQAKELAVLYCEINRI